MYTPRTLEETVDRINRQLPVLLVTGARQVGKTTLLRHLCSDTRATVSLDDPRLLELARKDPALLFQRFKPPILIDEIQYAPGLLPYIKMDVDARGEPGRYWLTGSQQFHLMRDVSESLAGRVAVLHLLGLSRREWARNEVDTRPFLPPVELDTSPAVGDDDRSLMAMYRYIWRGAFPAVALNPDMDRDVYFSSYMQTYLQRDLRDLARVGDEMAFLRFVRAVAARTGQLLNLSDLARDADIAVNTAKSWLSILETSGIVYLLEPYHTNVTRRLVKAPKVYFLDTGLCAWLTEWTSPETLEAGAMSGAIFETWVVAEVLKSYLHRGLRAPLYFYRDKDKKEIDLLIVRDGMIHPVEVKKTASPSADDARHFKVLDKLNLPVAQGCVVCQVERWLPLARGLTAVPVSDM